MKKPDDVVSVFKDALIRIMKEDVESASRKRKYRDERVLYEREVDVLVEFFKRVFEGESLDIAEEFRRVLDDIKVEG